MIGGAIIAVIALALSAVRYLSGETDSLDAVDVVSEDWLSGAHRTWHRADVSDLPVISGSNMLTISAVNGKETLTSWDLKGRWPEKLWDLKVDRTIGVRTPTFVGDTVAVGNLIIDAKNVTVMQAPWSSQSGHVELLVLGSIIVSCEGEECTGRNVSTLDVRWSAPRSVVETLRPNDVDSSVIGLAGECASFNGRTGEKRPLGKGENCRTLPVTNGFLVIATSDTTFDAWVYNSRGTRLTAHHEDSSPLDPRTIQMERAIAGYFSAHAYSPSVQSLKKLVDALPEDPAGYGGLSTGLLSNSITGVMARSEDSRYLLGAGMRSKRWFSRAQVFDTLNGQVVEWPGIGAEDTEYYRLVSKERIIAYSPTSGVTVYEAGQ